MKKELTLAEAQALLRGLNELTVERREDGERRERQLPALLSFAISENLDELQPPLQNAAEAINELEDEDEMVEKEQELLQREKTFDLEKVNKSDLPEVQVSVIRALKPVLK